MKYEHIIEHTGVNVKSNGFSIYLYLYYGDLVQMYRYISNGKIEYHTSGYPNSVVFDQPNPATLNFKKYIL